MIFFCCDKRELQQSDTSMRIATKWSTHQPVAQPEAKERSMPITKCIHAAATDADAAS